MQYFPGYSSFTDEKPFDASLFVDFRKRLGIDNVNAINERIVALKTRFETHPTEHNESNSSIDSDFEHDDRDNDSTLPPGELPHKGRVIFDATAYPQDIAYPTDLGLLNDAREKVEELVLNLVKLAGVALLRPYWNVVESFSAWVESAMIISIEEFKYLKSFIRIDSSMKNIIVKQVA